LDDERLERLIADQEGGEWNQVGGKRGTTSGKVKEKKGKPSLEMFWAQRRDRQK